MDLEQTIAAANRGDTEAMLDLGEYYMNSRNITLADAKKALELFSRCAKKGDNYGALRAADICKVLGPLYEKNGDLDTAARLYQDGLAFTNQVLITERSNQDRVTLATDIRDEHLYGLAKFCYHKNDLQGALDRVLDMKKSDARTAIMKAACMTGIEKYANPQGYETAFQLFLSALQKDEPYVAGGEIANASLLEQTVMLSAAGMFALCLDRGVLEGGPQLKYQIYHIVSNAITWDYGQKLLKEQFGM